MSSNVVKVLIVIAIAVLIGVVVGVARQFVGGKRVYTVEGVITYLEPETRMAGFEFKHPRDGSLREKTAKVPADCEILLNGKPAEMKDLKVGDRGKVVGSWTKRTKELIPLSVRINREGASPQPSTSASTQPKE